MFNKEQSFHKLIHVVWRRWHNNEIKYPGKNIFSSIHEYKWIQSIVNCHKTARFRLNDFPLSVCAVFKYYPIAEFSDYRWYDYDNFHWNHESITEIQLSLGLWVPQQSSSLLFHMNILLFRVK